MKTQTRKTQSELELLDGIQAQYAVADAMESWLKAAKSAWILLRTTPGDEDDLRHHDLFLKGPEGELVSLDITLKPAKVKDGWNVVHVTRKMFQRQGERLAFIDIPKFRMAVMQELGEVLRAAQSVKLTARC